MVSFSTKFAFSGLLSVLVALIAVVYMNSMMKEMPNDNNNNNSPTTTHDTTARDDIIDAPPPPPPTTTTTAAPKDDRLLPEQEVLSTSLSSSSLEKARLLIPPTANLQKDGEYEHEDWWRQHDSLLKDAWKEWEENNNSNQQLPTLNPEIIMDPTLRQAVETVRQNPTLQNEDRLRNLFEPILPQQVYKIPSFFSPRGIQQIRKHLDSASYYYCSGILPDDDDDNNTRKAGIPTRRPNGMNRFGIIIDPNIDGAVSYEAINTYVEELISDYVRPLCRMLFPQMTSRQHSQEDDEEYYAFTIRYRSDLDMELAEHSDASLYTININLNYDPIMDKDDDNVGDANNTKTGDELGGSYSGSSLYFVDSSTSDSLFEFHNNSTDNTEQQQKQVHASFNPGMAVIHRGQTRHAALPITKGERHNLVIWLFGKDAYVRIAPYENEMEQLTVQERWG